MSNNALSTLKFVTADRPAASIAVNPIERRRMALVRRIEEQLALVHAQLEGKTPDLTRSVKNKETGQKEMRPKSVRPWFVSSNGRVVLFIRYGLHTLQFAKGTNAIEAPSLKALVSTLETIKIATQHGELDSAIAGAAGKRGNKARS